MKTVLYITLLLGLLPSLAIAGIIEVGLRFGAGQWPDLAVGIVLGIVYLALIAGGAYAFTRVRS